jgi:hypothetical protein
MCAVHAIPAAIVVYPPFMRFPTRHACCTLQGVPCRLPRSFPHRAPRGEGDIVAAPTAAAPPEPPLGAKPGVDRYVGGGNFLVKPQGMIADGEGTNSYMIACAGQTCREVKVLELPELAYAAVCCASTFGPN